MNENVRVRLAPSPTGDPHVGTAYVGLINYAFARKHGGKFILRIEDTDRERSTKESEEQIYEALRWVGLSWDEGPDVGGPYGPYRQSERSEIYKEHANKLVERGTAYPCFCTPEKLEEIRQRQRALKKNVGYDGTCRSIPHEEAIARMKSGEPHVIRLAVPQGGTTVVRDRLRGEVVIENSQIDDQILLKSDGFPTYHLANVVDDHLMKISHVIRAEEWITSTPKHVLLYRAFEWEMPEWVHLPLLRNKDKSKISKRKNPVSLLYYRHIGILPETMRNFLALLGHSMPDEREVFELEDFVREFSFERIHLGGPVFDLEKLRWLNGVRIRSMTPEMFAERLRETVFSRDSLVAIAPLIQERVMMLGEVAQAIAYFHQPEVAIPLADLIAAGKGKTPAEVATILSGAGEAIDVLRGFDKDSIETAMRSYANEAGIGTGELFMMLRIAITGRKATPPLFETMAVLGRACVSQRLRAAAELAKGYKAQK